MPRYRFLAKSIGLCTVTLIVAFPFFCFEGGCRSQKDETGTEAPSKLPSEQELHGNPSLPDKLDGAEISMELQSQAETGEPDSYKYDSTGKRDPFKSFIVVSPEPKARQGNEPLSPLQRFDISQLRLVGTISGKGSKRALVEDAAGKGYILSVGTYVGKNGGKVIKITDGEAIIEEFHINYFGKRQSQMISMKLPKDTEGED